MPEEVIEEGFGTWPFEIAIYRNEDLDDHRGNDPEYTVVNHLSPALSEIGINHRIRWNFDPVPVNNNNNGCPGDDRPTVAYELWADYLRSGNAPFVAKDSNLLINDAEGGGCGSVGGSVCVASGSAIDRVYDRNIAGATGWQWHVQNCMHEIGHNMGFGHSPNPAWKYIDGDERLNFTPTNGDNEPTNMCGESVAQRPNNGKTRVPNNYYHHCVAEHVKIEEPQDTGTVEIIDVTVTPNPAIVDEPVTIEATMRNTTSSRVQKDEPLLWGDNRVHTFNFDVAAGDTQTLSAFYRPVTTGEFIVQVNQGIDNVIVEEEMTGEGDLDVVDVSVDPETATFGEVVTVTITAENDSEFPVVESVPVFVSGDQIGSVMFDIDGRGVNRPPPTQQRERSWTADQAGLHTVAAGDESTVVTVEEDSGNGNGNGRAGPDIDPRVAAGVIVVGGGIYLLNQRQGGA